MILLLVLGFSSSSASSQNVGFESWVCGRQVGIREVSGTDRIAQTNGATYLGGNGRLVINGQADEVTLSPALESAGVSINTSTSSFGLPVSRDFELKATSNDNLSWLKGAIQYPEASNKPVLVASANSVSCPFNANNVWNIFVAKVDNSKKTYVWQKVGFNELASIKVKSSDGGALPDCVVLDYGADKIRPEFRCAYLLKHDFERCPEADKSKCDYRELTSKQGGTSN